MSWQVGSEVLSLAPAMIAPAANAITSASRTARIRSGTGIRPIHIGSQSPAHGAPGPIEDLRVPLELEAVARRRRPGVELGRGGGGTRGGKVPRLDRGGTLRLERAEPEVHGVR